MTGRWPALLRYRVALLISAAAALGLLDAGLPSDMNLFARGGHAIVSGDFAHVYALPGTQAGPIQLVLSWLLMLGSSGSGPAWPVAAAINAAAMFAALRLCRRHTNRQVLVGLLVLCWLTPGPLWDGHPVEVLIATLWLVAVADVGAGRNVRAGVALGLTVAIAPWGVLGFPAVLACRRLHNAYVAGIVGIAVAGLLYLPFTLSGHFALFGYSWEIGSHSLVHLLAPGLHQMSWRLRIVQAAVVSGGTGCAALLVRRQQAVPAVAVLIVAVLRVGTDPVQLGYYWTSVGIAAIAMAATIPATRQARWAAAVAYVAWVGATTGWTLEAVGVCLALAVPIAAGQDAMSIAPLGLRLGRPSRMINS